MFDNKDPRNNSFREIWKELKNLNRILLILHEKPDGDSLGSCAAMKYVLQNMGKSVRMISKDPINNGLNFYEFSKDVEYNTNAEDINLTEFDCVILLDQGSLYSFSSNFGDKLKSIKVINIDHHSTNSYYGNLNYVDSSLPSCCSILFNFFDKMGVKFDRELSLRLAVGICTDTAFFIHGNTLDSLKKVYFLLQKGKIDYKKELYDPVMTKSWEAKKINAILLSNMIKEKIDDKTVAYSWITKKDYSKFKLKDSDFSLGISCMQDIKDLDLIFVLGPLDKEIKGSFRSQKWDTTIYSTAFNGGGHKLASGFKVKTTDMKKAIKEVLNVIKEKGFVEANNNSE